MGIVETWHATSLHVHPHPYPPPSLQGEGVLGRLQVDLLFQIPRLEGKSSLVKALRLNTQRPEGIVCVELWDQGRENHYVTQHHSGGYHGKKAITSYLFGLFAYLCPVRPLCQGDMGGRREIPIPAHRTVVRLSPGQLYGHSCPTYGKRI
jgi:hypothetical protein